MNSSICYYITGPDGSGKTTYINEIYYYLQNKNVPVQHIWLRSPKILSKPLMVYCRLVGLTKYKTINGFRYGVHEFYKSKFVSWIFPLLQLIDFQIKKWLVFSKINQMKDFVILLDRFALDTLADLMVDTGRYDLHLKRIGKSFRKLMPVNTKIIVLNTRLLNRLVMPRIIPIIIEY